MRALGKSLLASSALMLIASNLLLAASQGPDLSQGPITAPAKPPRPQTTCPVMGGPIDKSLYVDAKGKRIYLCCAACEDAIRAEPDKYIRKIEQRGQSLEDAPTP